MRDENTYSREPITRQELRDFESTILWAVGGMVALAAGLVIAAVRLIVG